MLGVTIGLRALRLCTLALVLGWFAIGNVAHAKPTTYACPPGVADKGVGCKCPLGYSSNVDADGVATCQLGAQASGAKKKQPPALSYDNYLSLANGQVDRGNCKGAQPHFSAALQKNRKGIEALVGSGMCFVETAEYSSAHSRFREALALDPRYEGALWGVAEAYRRQGKRDDAIAAYRQYLDLFPSSYKAKAALEKLQGKNVVVEEPATTAPARGPAYNVVIAGTRITINGKELSGTPMMADIEAIFGRPDRTWDTAGGINKVHTWDKLGVVAYEPKDGNGTRCISLTLPFRAMGMDYDPRTFFGGTVRVDGSALTAFTTLRSAKAMSGATQPYGATSVVFPKGDFNVFTNATDESSQIGLVELSLWKNGIKQTASTGGATSTRVVISGSRITVNGKELSGTPMMADVEGIFGRPDRTWDTSGGINKVHTWDRLGVVAYEPKDGTGGRCISLTLPFRAMGMDYDPKTMFAGSVIVDGNTLSGTTLLSTARGMSGSTQPYGATSVVFPKGDFNVFMNAKDATSAIGLVEISMWKNGVKQTAGGGLGAGAGKVTRTGDVKVSVTGTRVTMNGASLSGTPMLADFERVYGKADRVWDQGSGNRVHTWDALGLIVYEPRDGRAISATFPFRPMNYGYDPKTMFAGSITVDGSPMLASHDLATIKARPGATQPYSASSIVFDKGDIHVFTIAKGTGTIDLVEISFWQKTKVDPTPVKKTPQRSLDVVVTVNGSAIVMNGVSISGKPMVADLESAFGKADRVWETKGGINRIHTWDRLGILVYEPMDNGAPSGRCISATFPFKPLGGTFDPSTMFGGSITVDGNRMTPSTTLATVKARPGAGMPYGPTSIVFDKGDIHVFTQADNDSAGIELVELSFWQKNK